MKTLPKEAFELKKELASLGVAVSRARGELSGVKETVDKRLELAEKEAESTVRKTLQSSQKTLKEALGLKDEVSSWANEVSNYSMEVAKWRLKMIREGELEAKRINQAKKTLSGSLKETEDATAEITALRSTIKAERELLERERKANSNQLTLIASERAKLAVALKEYDGRSKGRK